MFESYLDGLHDSAYPVEREQVWFGFSASAALRVGIFELIMMGHELEQDPGQFSAPASVPDCFEVTMVREAYRFI